jgi:hypothetical protein
VGEAGGDGVPEKEKEARAAGRRSRMGGRRGHVGGVDTGHTLIGLFANDPPPLKFSREICLHDTTRLWLDLANIL